MLILKVPQLTSPALLKSAAAPKRAVLRYLLAAMRPHQWVKNVFVLSPLLFSKSIGDPDALRQGFLAFVAFCLASSAVYILNDIQDAQVDRLHPKKQFRPIASGDLSRSAALTYFGVLLILSLTLSSWLGYQHFLFAAAYMLLMAGYCLSFKRIIILDAMCIAAGFVLRVAGGAAAISVDASHWLIICAFLLALYLAFAKRRQEMLTVSKAAGHRKVLGEYTLPFLEQVNTILLGILIVCYALYAVAPETVARFGTDSLVYGILFVIYGLLRYLSLIQNSEKGGDPGNLLATDKPLAAAVAGWTIYNAAVIYRNEFIEFWKRLF